MGMRRDEDVYRVELFETIATGYIVASRVIFVAS
jgi:hypothetical protein